MASVAAIVLAAVLHGQGIPQVDLQTRAKLARDYVEQAGSAWLSLFNGTGGSVASAGVAGVSSNALLLGGLTFPTILTNGQSGVSLSNTTLNGTTTLTGPITAAAANSTAASDVANVGTLNNLYRNVIDEPSSSSRWRAYIGSGSGNEIPAVEAVSNFSDNWGYGNPTRVWRKTGSYTSMALPIPSSWPADASVICRSTWYLAAQGGTESNIVVRHGFFGASTNYPFPQFSRVGGTIFLSQFGVIDSTLSYIGVTNGGFFCVTTNSLSAPSLNAYARSFQIQRLVTSTNDTYPTNVCFSHIELELIRP